MSYFMSKKYKTGFVKKKIKTVFFLSKNEISSDVLISNSHVLAFWGTGIWSRTIFLVLVFEENELNSHQCFLKICL